MREGFVKKEFNQLGADGIPEIRFEWKRDRAMNKFVKMETSYSTWTLKDYLCHSDFFYHTYFYIW